jgi:hypothetical protein
VAIANPAYRDEFAALFRYNLFSYYKLITHYTPDRNIMTIDSLDSVDVLRNKILGFIKYKSPARVAEDAFVINYSPVSRELHTLVEFKEYIADLNKVLSGYAMKRIHSGDDLPETLKKFELHIIEMLARYNLVYFADNILDVIGEIPRMLLLDEKERTDFYRDLVNNFAAKNGIFAIVSQTVDEFLVHADPDEEKRLLNESEHCGCLGRDGEPKARYSRLSFVLVIIENSIASAPDTILSVYPCRGSFIGNPKKQDVHNREPEGTGVSLNSTLISMLEDEFRKSEESGSKMIDSPDLDRKFLPSYHLTKQPRNGRDFI